jgi:hypothetical protein
MSTIATTTDLNSSSYSSATTAILDASLDAPVCDPSGNLASDSACAATCCTPAGAVQTISTPTEAYAALVGRWLLCPTPYSAFGEVPADAIGVEYGPAVEGDAACALTGGVGGNCGGGNMYYLVQGPSGPERGQGFAYELTYDVSTFGNSVQLNMHPAPNSGFGGSFRYSPCPTELFIPAMLEPGGTTLVHID